MTAHATVLIVDDEVRSLESLRRVLCEDFEVICAHNAAEAEAVLTGEMVQVILCDQRMPGESGVEFLKRAREQWPDTVRMIISGYTDSEDIIAGVNEAGIYRYITKPWHPDKLLATVREAAQLFHLQRESGIVFVDAKPSHDGLQRALGERRRSERRMYEFNRIVHVPESPIRPVIALAQRAAEYDISVLITGASGTGKELLARAIHHGSARAEEAFVVENCGALPDELLESELFGCKKGAFTGAYQDRIGLFEVADGGSIFLDEIGETSPAFQVKLLRVLQEGEIPAARGAAAAQGECPGHIGDQPRHDRGSGSGPLPARPLLPARDLSDPYAALARATDGRAGHCSARADRRQPSVSPPHSGICARNPAVDDGL